jgi:hypothetical protein
MPVDGARVIDGDSHIMEQPDPSSSRVDAET